MRRHHFLLACTLCGVLAPSAAYGMGEVPPLLSAGAGVLGLLFAAALLVAMLSVRCLAEGAAIAENIKYAVLAAVCLAASLLAGWVARWVPTFSVDHARLGGDLLSVVALALFGIYFVRVRGAMVRYLGLLNGEEQLLTAVVDPDSDLGGTPESEERTDA